MYPMMIQTLILIIAIVVFVRLSHPLIGSRWAGVLLEAHQENEHRDRNWTTACT